MRPAKIPPPSEDLVGDECERCGRIYPDEKDSHKPGVCVAPWGRDRDCETLYLARLEAQAHRDQETIRLARKCIEAADKLVTISNRKHDFWDAYHAARAEFAKVESAGTVDGGASRP